MEPEEKEKKQHVVAAHPLHACCANEEVLLEDNEAESLTGILARSGPFLALNISLLLLPYERIKIMHSNLSLSLVNVAEASLRIYLEKQLESLDDSLRLRSNSKEVIPSALTSLSSCTKSR